MKGIIIAFALYSKIPMPRVEWNEVNIKYAIGFFPLVGVAVGGLFYVNFLLLEGLGASDTLQAAWLAVLPILVTGGIHMDGFLDVIDAKHCYGSREKRLEILKDPHVGAFAVIYALVYVILMMGIYSGLSRKLAAVTAAGFICSRGFSGLGAVSLPNARKEGMLRSITKDAGKKRVIFMNLAGIAAGAVLAIWIQPLAGCVALMAGGGVFCYYRYMACKEFGGVTGDLAGYFLQLFELAWAGVCMLCYLFKL